MAAATLEAREHLTKVDVCKKAQAAVQWRIAIVREWKQHAGPFAESCPLDLDEMAPGTGDLIEEKFHCREDVGYANRMRMKMRAGGLIGVTYEQRTGRYLAKQGRYYLGTYRTAAEAACRYNEDTLKRFEDKAVLCCLEAAKRYQERCERKAR